MVQEHSAHFIDGEWVPSVGRSVSTVVSPSTEEDLASIRLGNEVDIDRAVSSAKRALQSAEWKSYDLDARLQILSRVKKALQEKREEFAHLLTQQMGSPISQSLNGQVASAIATLDAYLSFSRDYPFSSLRISEAASALVLREPVGVVAAISPWNSPLTINMQKIVPAIIAGNTVVLKPAAQTPLDAYWLVELFQEAGLPSGVLNVVAAERPASESLVSHPDVRLVTFTGSTSVGRHLSTLAGKNLRRIMLELGGKSAGIILDDADLDTTVDALRTASFRNSGQVCSLKTRILISESRKDELLDRLKTMTESLQVGDPFDPRTDIGPMVTSAQQDTVNRFIESGIAEGATRITDSDVPSTLTRGWYVAPTVFGDVTPEMEIAREEIFGPVISVMTFKDEAEAINLANDSRYGLNGAVFSDDPNHAIEIAKQIYTGTVEINGSRTGYHAPMGGVRDSGLGRANGPEGLDAYTELKSIGLSPSLAQTFDMPS